MEHLSFLHRHGTTKLLRFGLTFFLLAQIVSCGNLSQYGMNTIGANVTPIKELKQQLKDNPTVYIQGKVERQVPFLQQQAYQINDSTGKIWVLTHQTNLKPGEQVVFKGQLRYQSIPLGGKDYGEVYLEEQ